MIFCPSGTSNTTLNNGVIETCPTATHVARYYTQLVLNGNLVIPPQKPPKTHIIKSTYDIKIRDVEVLTVTLPNGVVAGNKIVVSGTITLYIQYIADVPEQKVHVVHYDLPFNALVMDDCGKPINPADPIFPDNFVVHVCVEKTHFTQIDNRTISKQIVLMVWVEENI